jgi:predicted nucleotidyltransferase
MTVQSRLGRQIEEIIGLLNGLGIRFALIGGLALAPHKVVRATIDVDLLTDATSADAIEQHLLVRGYKCLHRSNDAANYLRGDERLDFLFASRPAALEFLATASELPTPFGALRVVHAEGLIALKLQALVNNPRRTQDLEDIRSLLRANRETINLTAVREYFRLFDRDALLTEILRDLD